MNEHFSVLSLLIHLNWPGDIVFTIYNLAIIIFNGTSKLLVQKSHRGIAVTLFIEIVDTELLKYEVETLDGGI